MLDNFGIAPTRADGSPKQRFEVKMKVLGSDPKKDGVEKAVFVDGKKLDFKIDVLRFLQAKSRGVDEMIREQKRIEREFINSVSEAVGRRVTREELKIATIEGWI
jgi:hypothetical protein